METIKESVACIQLETNIYKLMLNKEKKLCLDLISEYLESKFEAFTSFEI